MTEIIRYRTKSGGQIGAGLRVSSGVLPIGQTSIADLLTLRRSALEELYACVLEEHRDELSHDSVTVLAPIDGLTEVWAAGVTYRQSKIERMEESRISASIYDDVYDAERPELFFKSTAWRVVGNQRPIAIRIDSEVNVPEPELAVVINRHREIVGYTVCNDVSSRSIEGENPLYLPQAKIYFGSCSVGPGIRPAWEIDPSELTIELKITRGEGVVWEGVANTRDLHRTIDDLATFLFRANVFPQGAILSTGTSLVPALPFSLTPGDSVAIEIEEIGTLTNIVMQGIEAILSTQEY